MFGLGELPLAILAIATALVPAAVAFVRGRQLARFADDPALPERLLAGRPVASTWLAGTIAVLIMLTGRDAIWAIPLAIAALAAARLPLRRILYGETWSLPVYLSFVIRFIVAFWSFWVLLCALPALALSADGRAWLVAAAIGTSLILLATYQTEWARWLIGARPVADEAIRLRFDRLVAAAGLAAPYFECVDLRGGIVANAIALPSLRRSAVLVTGPLLERLDADETDAICAHELAHIEFHNTRRLRRVRLISRTLVVGGALLTPLVHAVAPSVAWLACIAWPATVMIVMLLLVRDRQQHETASDLRAVALTGNPEALVRALVKLHAIARVPRRWDANLERHHSHPSLKRRIQSIRAAAGTPPAALGDTAVFESADGASRAVFGTDGIEWIEGTSASYRLRYDRLGDLRVVAPHGRETSLVAADRTGHRWQMPIRADDVPRIQAVLDIVEARVETVVPAATTVRPLLIRAATFVVLICMLNAGLIASAMVAALTLARPETPLLGAAGLAAVGGAVLTWRDSQSTFGVIPDEYRLMLAAVLLAGGMVLVWLAYTRRRDEIPAAAWKRVGVLALVALAAWILPIVGSGVDALGLHQAARQWSSSVVLPLALTGALMWSARKTLRGVAAFAAIASVAAAWVGSQAFLDRFGNDVFLVPARDVQVRTLDRPVKEFTIPFGVNGLRLSPTGRSIAVTSWRQNDNHVAIQIGRAGEALTALDGDGVLFIDDDRALVWTTDGSRTDLREVLAAAPEDAIWQVRVTGLPAPAVSLDRKTNRWRVSSQAGTDVVEGREGVIGADRIDSYRWSLSTSHGSPVVPIALSGDRALALEPRVDLSLPLDNPMSALFFVFASTPRWRSTVWALGPDGPADLGTSRLELECHLLPLDERGACQMFDASRTRFFIMDAATRGMTAVASLPGRFFVGQPPDGPWVSGWYQSHLVAVRLAPADAIRVAGPNGAQPHLLAVSDRAAAGVWFQAAAASTLRLDPVGQGVMASTIRIYSID
jgi:Zn-dependent protease with chaperone function